MPTGQYTDYLANKILDHVFGGGDFSRPTVLYISALKAGDVEVTGGGYARVTVTNGLANFPASTGRAKANANTIPFAQATADWGFIEAIGIHDALTGGNMLAKVPLAGAFVNFTADATLDQLTSNGHGFVANQRVRVEALPGVSLPTPLAAGVTYYVVSPATNTLKLAATSGGAAIDITAPGGGVIALYKARDVYTGDTLTFGAGDLAISHG